MVWRRYDNRTRSCTLGVWATPTDSTTPATTLSATPGSAGAACYGYSGAAHGVRRHISAVLQVAGLADDGRWIAVALIEEEPDDQYLVVGARVLTDPEIRAVQAMIEGNL